MKPLLLMTLIAMQLLSAGVSPMYLCLGCNGSVCLDGGPESCEGCTVSCRQEADAECSCHSAAACGHDHEESLATNPLAAEWTSVEGPCCCTHLPISVARAPNLTSSRVKFDATKFHACFSHWTCITATSDDLAWVRCQLRDKPAGPPVSYALRVLSTVNLRC